jgi:hypothetical protein
MKRPHLLLVMPDVHLAVDRAEKMVQTVLPDRTIWLGDWFDNFNTGPEQAEWTAGWLRTRMEAHPKDVFLWGNHDLHYRHPWPGICCSGFRNDNLEAIRGVLKLRHWNRFRWFHFEQGFLFTHAGLEGQAVQADDRLERGGGPPGHWLYEIGLCRGGRAPYGGIVWCDLAEYVPMPGQRQVFGHTGGPVPRRIGKNSDWCLDTGLRHLMTIVDGREAVREFFHRRSRAASLVTDERTTHERDETDGQERGDGLPGLPPDGGPEGR